MRKKWKKIKRKIISFLIKFLIKFLNILPLFFLKYLLKILSIFSYFALKKFRKIGIWTLETLQFKRGILKEYFKKIFEYFFDFLMIHRNGKKIEEIVEVKGEEILLKKFEKKKGVLAFTLHLGLWELIPIYFRRKNYPVNVVVSRVYTDEIDNIVNEFRKKEKINVIYRNEAIKIIKALKNGECVGILIDQYFKGKNMKTLFFGKEVFVPEGPFLIAYKIKPEVLIMGIWKEKDKYIIEIKDFEFKGDKKMDARNVMENFEKWIKKNPSQWTWIHDRFGYFRKWKNLK
jgi:KDO2-lipid IV(A) lauroyltransferase